MADKSQNSNKTPGAEAPTNNVPQREDHVLEDGVFRLENWLPYEFSRIANRVASMLARMVTERFRLSLNAWRVLAVLNNEFPLSAKQVAARTMLSPVNVSRALSQLDKLGMIKRSSNAADYRQVMLTPSKKGQAAYHEVVPLSMAIEKELLAGLKGTELAALRKLMASLSDSAATRLPETRDWRELLGGKARAGGAGRAKAVKKSA